MKSRIIAVISALFILASSCSSPEKKAKEQLKLHGYEFSESDFINAVQQGDAEAVKLFLDAGMSPDAEENGRTALIEAARRGHSDLALILIDAGADVNAKDTYGVSSLMFAAITGSGEVIVKLLEKSADVNVRDQDGRTALIEALTTENDLPDEMIKALIDASADVNRAIYNGITPVMLAADGSPQILRMIIAAGADVQAKDEEGKTALMRAKNQPENIKILEDAGAKE
jgi:ankyrin repeat protein